jgi:hypothetical protein
MLTPVPIWHADGALMIDGLLANFRVGSAVTGWHVERNVHPSGLLPAGPAIPLTQASWYTDRESYDAYERHGEMVQ